VKTPEPMLVSTPSLTKFGAGWLYVMSLDEERYVAIGQRGSLEMKFGRVNKVLLAELCWTYYVEVKLPENDPSVIIVEPGPHYIFAVTIWDTVVVP
jgi:hypothetical protein